MHDEFSEYTAARWHMAAQEAAFAALVADVLSQPPPIKYVPVSDADLAEAERELRGDAGAEA